MQKNLISINQINSTTIIAYKTTPVIVILFSAEVNCFCFTYQIYHLFGAYEYETII